MKSKNSFRQFDQSPKSNSRPISAMIRHPDISITHSRQYPKIINQCDYVNTSPSSSLQGLGSKIEKEQLYEQTMHLKKLVNKLNRELSETKANNVKLDIDLRKKEKIIKAIAEENEEEMNLIHFENRSKVAESNLITNCKREYALLKKQYDKIMNENEKLKTNIKIIKIKEIQIQTEILNEQMLKLKDLYAHSQERVLSYEKDFEELRLFKNKFYEQHAIIEGLQASLEIFQRNNENFQQKLTKENHQKQQIDTSNRKLQIENKKYENQIEQLLNEKKAYENFYVNKGNYEKQISYLTDEVAKYKELSKRPASQSNVMKTQGNNSYHSNKLRKLDYISVTTVEHISSNDLEDKNRFLQNIIKNYKFKIQIYEKYIRDNHDDPELILKNGNYNSGVINSNTQRTTIPSYQKTTFQGQEYDINEKIKNSVETNSNPSRTRQDNWINTDDNDKNNIMNVEYIRKCLEAAHAKSDDLLNSLNDIFSQFQTQEASEVDFIALFNDLFTQYLKLKDMKDKTTINDIISYLLQSNHNNTKKFYEIITNMFTSVIDYSKLQGIENIKSNLYQKLNSNNAYLINSFKANDKNNSGIIFYQDLLRILQEGPINLAEEEMEYILYLMKKDTIGVHSLFELNYEVIVNFLNDDNYDHLAENRDEYDDNGDFLISIEELEKINNQTIEIVFKIMQSEAKSFEAIFTNIHNEPTGEYSMISLNDFWNTLKSHGHSSQQKEIACFNHTYQVKSDVFEYDVEKIKDAIKNLETKCKDY